MKMKKKGKVHPSSSSSSDHFNEDDTLSVLKLLPATILVLVSVLPAEDREVLAYLITRGTTIDRSSSSKTKKNNKTHKPPVFGCECFDCYTNYWVRWDSSPNRDLIGEIVEAFENSASPKNSKRGKKKEKPGRVGDNVINKPVVEVETVAETMSYVSSPGRLSEAEVAEREPEDEVAEDEDEESTPTAATVHKGLARKVLSDVIGLLHSSFSRLWNPNA